MPQKITAKKFASNVIISISVQIISLLVSFVLNFVVPKFIDEFQYSYWQTYVLYVGYVGVLHFGLLDGLVLRYSQYDYDELDKERLRSQFKLLLAFTGFLTLLTTVISLLACKDTTQIIVILVACGIVTKNLVTYSSYCFQITNRISRYAILILVQRVSYGLIVGILLLCGINDFYWYCIADLSGDVIGFVLSCAMNRGMYLGRSIKLKDSFKELGDNVGAGIILMLANWSSMLMVGGAKMIVQWRWDEIVFGHVSFAFSVSNVFITFILAASVVLFPSLKRLDREKLPDVYVATRNVLSPLLFFAMIFFFPGCWILERWLPQYSDSLLYLGILLPLVIYSSKVSLLTNNYLKAYRKEKIMLLINMVSVAIGAIAFLLCAFVFNNLTALLISIVAVIMFNSMFSEIVVLHIIKKRIVIQFIWEALMTVGFILVVALLSRWWACLAYGVLFLAYAAVNYKTVLGFAKKVFRRKSLNTLPEVDGADEVPVKKDSGMGDNK